MKPEAKYTYQQWWKGKVILFESPTYLDESVQNNSSDEYKKIIRVRWEQFVDEDVDKIKNKQKELFHDSVNLTLITYKQIFLTDYENSKEKSKLIQREIDNCKSILYGKNHVLNYEEIRDLQSNRKFSLDDFQIIQNYATEHFIKGFPDNYSFIHSPNFKYKEDNCKKLIPQVYARVLWEFYEWLKDLEGRQKDSSLNQHPQIFISHEAFLLFDELFMQNKIQANASFLYRKMIEDKLIHLQFNESDFRLWIDKSYGIYFKSKLKVLKYSSPISRLNYYNKYKDAIMN